MKSIVIVFGLICAVFAGSPLANLDNVVGFTDPPPSINQHFVRFFHAERVNYTCGWPESGIPPLEPYHIEEYLIEMGTGADFRDVTVNMTNADLTLLHNMCLTDFQFSIAANAMRMVIHFDRLLLLGTHSTVATTLLGVAVRGEGPMRMELRDMHVDATAQLTNLPNGNLHVASMQNAVRVTSATSNFEGFGLMGGTINRVIGAAVPGMVADRQELINEKVNEMLLPSMNALFNEHNLGSLVNLMAGRVQNPGTPCAGAPVPRHCSFTG